MIGQQISHYLIEAELGRGGMGVVYLAADTRLERAVALKFLPPHLSSDPAARARFIHEAKAASALRHPAICSVYDIGESEDGLTFMVMPFYEGETVEERLKRDPFDPEEARSVAAQVADGLAAAHGAGIVHRDIKAANVIIGPAGGVTILDFGVAKFGTGEDLTKDGSTVGTTSYMSPEQVTGEEATEKGDLWSLGVLLHEMLAGKRPFGGGYDAAVAYSIVNQEPAALPASTPEDLANLVRSLLQKSPDARPDSAAVVHGVLRDAGRAAAVRAADPLVSPRMAWISGGVLLVALVAFFLTQYGGREASASQALDAIVVFPFDVQAGPELAYLERGMVSMLSPMIDGLGGIRAIDPKAVLGLLELRGEGLIDPDEGREIAAQFEAKRFILGALTQVGTGFQLATSLYSVNGDPVVEDVRTVAKIEDLLEASGGLLNAFVPELVDVSGPGLTGTVVGSTESFPSMKAYLLAEEAYRAGRFGQAFGLAVQALEDDSTFAAAWFLAANAGAQTSRPDYQQYRRGSLRHAENAPERLEMLIRARAAAAVDGWEETFRQLRVVLAFYPDDLDAIAYIADQTFHLNPWYGRASSDAIPGFYKVLEFDPDNGEYLGHLAALFFRDRRFAELDSLHSRFVASKDIPQAEDVALLHALAVDREGTLQTIRESSLERALQFLGPTVVTHDIEVAGTIVSRWAFGAGDDQPTRLQFFAHTVTAITGNRMALAETFARMHQEDPALAAIAMTELVVSAPYLPISPDSLRVLAASLGEPPQDMFDGAPAAFNYPGAARDQFAYFRARLAERSGDIETLRAQWILLRDVPDPAEPTQNMTRELEARVLVAEGSLEDALAALERIEHYPGYALYNGTNIHGGAHSRFLRAQVLLELGRNQDAVNWSRAVHDGTAAGLPSLLPLTYRLEAEAYSRLEDWDNAAERYERFIDLWKNADEDLQPEVEEARRRLQRVLDQKAMEPSG